MQKTQRDILLAVVVAKKQHNSRRRNLSADRPAGALLFNYSF